MFYYLYKIRNTLNDKIYVGVHKTKDMNDGYMGSGKVIKRAIEKYGIENFTKVILETFEDSVTMYAREKEVVTEEFLAREDTYNLRRGGHGGFDYINSLEQTHLTRKNGGINQSKNNKELGLGMYHNPKYRFSKNNPYQQLGNSPESRKKAIETAKRTFEKIQHQVGERNSQHNTHIYIDSSHSGELPNVKVLNKNRYKEGQQPVGWITIEEWKDIRKDKSNGAYGRHWYNDGVRNYYLIQTRVIV